MSTLRTSQALSEYPAQTRYWRDWAAALDTATLLHRDLLALAEEHRPVAVWETALDEQALGRAGDLTGGDTTLLQVLSTAVVAVVAAAETDSAKVCVRTVAEGRDFPVLVGVDRSADARGLLTAVRSAYLEGAAHLDVLPAAVLRQAGVVPTDLAVRPYDDAPEGTAPALPPSAPAGCGWPTAVICSCRPPRAGSASGSRAPSPAWPDWRRCVTCSAVPAPRRPS
jgi:hypothetical protein